MNSVSSQCSLSCRVMRREDAPLIRALFKEVFNEEMSQEFWEWKYGRSDCAAALVFQNDRLVAHYGGVGRRVQCRGERLLAAQIADVMVARSVRSSVRTNSPFHLMFSTFRDKFFGADKLYGTAYGFPNERAMRLARALGFYTPVGSVHMITVDAGTPRGKAGFKVEEIRNDEFESYRKPLERLWRRMSRSLEDKVVAIRDPDFIRFRYLQHPVRRYRLLLVRRRFTGRAVGLCVVRDDGENLFLMDLVCDVSRAGALVQDLQHTAFQNGKKGIRFWCSSDFLDCFLVPGARNERLPVTIPTEECPGMVAPALLAGRWWIMAGDSDFQ